MKCGLLLEGPRNSTVQAARLAMKACKTEQKATAALEQALALLTSPAPGAQHTRAEEKAAEEEAAADEKPAATGDGHNLEEAADEEQEEDPSTTT